MEVFFYGLFMDSNVLKQKGIEISNPRKAFLQNYKLVIGNRASLIPSENERSYGILINIESEKVDSLYSESSVNDYTPEKVLVTIESGELISA